MPSVNKTEFLKLNQWTGDEYLKRSDLVEDNKKIDNSVKKINDDLEALQSDLENKDLTYFETDKYINDLKDSVNGFMTDFNIKGRTLINLFRKESQSTIADTSEGKNKYFAFLTSSNLLKINSRYTIKIIDPSKKVLGYALVLRKGDDIKTDIVLTSTYTDKFIYPFDTPGNFDSSWRLLPHFTFSKDNPMTQDEIDNLGVLILEGDYTSKYIPPYFEGVKSVGELEHNSNLLRITTNYSKNLFDPIQGSYYHSSPPVPNNQYRQGEYWDDKTRISHRNSRIFVNPNTSYTVSVNNITNLKYIIHEFSCDNLKTSDPDWSDLTSNSFTFKTNPETRFMCIAFKYDDTSEIHPENFKIQLEEGAVATEYERYNGDNLNIQLGQPLRSINDTIFDEIKDNKLYRNIKEVILDGNQIYTQGSREKSYYQVTFKLPYTTSGNIRSYKYNMKKCGQGWYNGIDNDPDGIWPMEGNNGIYIQIPNEDSGWGENYTPTLDEIKAYFYGWRMHNADGTTPYTSGTKWWRTVSTNTLAQNTVPTNRATDGYMPYRLCHKLATPIIEPLNAICLKTSKNCRISLNNNITPTITAKYPTRINDSISSLSESVRDIRDSLPSQYPRCIHAGYATGTTKLEINIPEITSSIPDCTEITFIPNMDIVNPTLTINNFSPSPILRRPGVPLSNAYKGVPIHVVRVGINFFISSTGKYDVGDVLPNSSISVLPREIESEGIWSVQVSENENFTPTHLASYGDMIYIVSCDDNGTKNHKLTAKSSVTGKTLWEVNYNPVVSTSSLIADSSGVYVDAYPNVEKYSTTGTKCWTLNINRGVLWSMAVNNTSLYVTSSNKKTICLDTGTGKLKWEFVYGDSAHWCVCTYLARVFIACSNGFIYSIDINGVKIGETQLSLSSDISIRNICVLGDSIFAFFLNGCIKLSPSLQFQSEIHTISTPGILISAYSSSIDRLLVAGSGYPLCAIQPNFASYESIKSIVADSGQLCVQDNYTFTIDKKNLNKNHIEFNGNESSYKIIK